MWKSFTTFGPERSFENNGAGVQEQVGQQHWRRPRREGEERVEEAPQEQVPYSQHFICEWVM
jgi:hypothetical protein